MKGRFNPWFKKAEAGLARQQGCGRRDLLYETPIASIVALPSLYGNDLEYTDESFRPIQFSPGTDLRQKSIRSLFDNIPLTPQVAGVNNTGQIEKRFTALVFGTGLTAIETERV